MHFRTLYDFLCLAHNHFAGGIPCDEVLSTTTGALPRDDRARWGGRALIEATWHWRGQRSGVDSGDDTPMIGGGSDDVLQHQGSEGSEVRPREDH
jgi:hypothetical protein